MYVEIRLYRRHDADLMMLKSYGVNIAKLMKICLDNYVEGKRIKFSLPGAQECPVKNTSMLRYHLNVTNPKAVALLKSLKGGYRNQFCKMLLRDSLDAEPLGVYFVRDIDIESEGKRLSSQVENLGVIGKLGHTESHEELKDKILSRGDREKTNTEEAVKEKQDDAVPAETVTAPKDEPVQHAAEMKPSAAEPEIPVNPPYSEPDGLDDETVQKPSGFPSEVNWGERFGIDDNWPNLTF